MTFYEKSLSTIEIPAVLQMLSQEASGEAAKQAALDLTPSSDIYEVRARLSETSAAKSMMTVKGSPSFAGVRDVRGSIRRADIGGMLNTTELLDIGSLLRCASSAISYASGEMAEKTAIDYLFSSIHANKYLETKISTSIVGVDEVADSASHELADIRRHMRIAGDKVRQSLNKIISSPAYAKALQEPIITMKNDRYVVPVKAEQKSAVPGLVHDISSSGATLFIEPMSAVKANNEIRELLAKEKKEIERILMELSAEVSSCGEDIICNFNVLSQLDLIFAKAKLSYKLNGGEPIISEDGRIDLKRARHPLLARKTAVPVDIRLGGEFDTLVITGPNTGGKTVSIKTIGIMCAMAQCGLHIPADDGSCVPIFKSILADIGDEQSIEQSLSTFSSHMTNIVKILEECGEDTLVLFDELGAGTDPTEGAALAVAIIEHVRNMGACVAATTHYAELKIYATTSPGVQNASCEFDVETLCPTYKLLIGIPGKSNAFAISSRLGLPEQIIEDAKSRVDSDNAAFEEVLANLENTRHQMEGEKAETRRLLLKAEQDAKLAEARRSETEREKEKAAVIARREADKIIAQARKTAEEVFTELSDMRKKAAKNMDWQKTNESKSAIYHKLNEAEGALTENVKTEEPPSSRPPRAGDKVKLVRIGTTAEVISVSPDGVLTLQAGIMKISAKMDEVRLIEGNAQPEIKKYLARSEAKLRNIQVSSELDIRGMMTDEAIPIVERFIDSAHLGKLNTVTIIHGKGTGALRATVQQALKRNRQVKSFRIGRYGEGEMGVTIVELR